MATFTVLDAAQLQALATQFALGTVVTSRAIAAGTINSNFLVDTDTGRYFLRINEGKSEDDVAWEARLVTALAERGVVAPCPIAARDGRAYAAVPVAGDAPVKWASAFPWRPGHHLAADAVTTEHARVFGAALAQLHVAALALPPAWQRRSIYDHDHLVARFQTIEAAHDPELAPAIAVLRDELAAASAAAAIRRAATHGIIHGDLFRDNVLWDGPRITAILDFEQASGGSLAYDLAVCINDRCWSESDRAPRADLVAALLAGYRAVRALPAADRAAVPVELRASATRFTITRITDVYLARVANPEKDFRAFLARVEVWRTETVQALTPLL